ncbi:TetR/AcrR family transcriptional regulator [Thalassobaculum sp.]|uniref:TetR/AcrR family transcriptional regulator n=1 Tax=Thalassobaculum sp. TaxID=2022740 RepID=UPI0032EDACE6
MPPRRYRQNRRAESAEETRRRIVEATFALHDEQGIAATSMKQIAERAEVSVGTVYHHFPTYEDAVIACGQHTVETIPPPDAGIFAGLTDAGSRVERLVAELFSFYARLPVLERVRCDQHLMPVLRRFIDQERQNRRALFELALGPGTPPQQVDVAIALTDPAVHSALTQAGWSTGNAASEIARTLTISLLPATP